MRALLLVLLIPGAMAWSLGDAPSETLEGAYAPGAAPAIPADGTVLWAAAPEEERRQFMSDVALEVVYTGAATGTRVATLMVVSPDGTLDALGAAQTTGPATRDTLLLPVEGQIIEPGQALALSLRFTEPVIVDGAASGFELPLITIGPPAPVEVTPEPAPAPEPATTAQEAPAPWRWLVIAGVIVLAAVALIGGLRIRRSMADAPAPEARGPRRPKPAAMTTAEGLGPRMPPVHRPRQDEMLEQVQAHLVAVDPSVIVHAPKRQKAARCTATTSTGERCRRPPSGGMDTCSLHHGDGGRRPAGPWA